MTGRGRGGPRFTSEQMAGVYGRTCDTYDSVIPYFSTFGRRLVEVARVCPGEVVLDAASGRGAILLPAAAAVGAAGHVTGIDLSDEMVRALRDDAAALHCRNVSIQRMDAEALTFDDRSFDVVLCGCAIQIMPDPQLAAAGFLRVLRPGGRVGLSVPAETSGAWGFFVPLIESYADRATGPMPPLSGAQGAAPDRPLATVVADAGFEDVRVSEVEASFVFPDEEAWWRWAWSVGLRAFLEAFPPKALADLKRDAFAHLRHLVQPDGLHLEQRARFIFGNRPA